MADLNTKSNGSTTQRPTALGNQNLTSAPARRWLENTTKPSRILTLTKLQPKPPTINPKSPPQLNPLQPRLSPSRTKPKTRKRRRKLDSKLPKMNHSMKNKRKKSLPPNLKEAHPPQKGQFPGKASDSQAQATKQPGLTLLRTWMTNRECRKSGKRWRNRT
jgi:hypothetical protein